MKFHKTIYIKKCNHCNLKYLGITKQDINIYIGSGDYWKTHLDKHNATQKNLFIKHFNDENYFYRCCNQLSDFFNVVCNNEFANLTRETGTGGDTFNCKTEEEKNEIRKRISEGLKNAYKNGLKKIVSEKTRNKLREKSKGNKSSLGRIVSQETKDKIGKANKGKKSWNKGGTVSQETKDKISKANKGRKLTKEHIDKIIATKKSKRKNKPILKKEKKSRKGIKQKKKGCIRKQSNFYRFIYTLNSKRKSKSFKTRIEAEIAQKIYMGAYRILEEHY